MGKKKNYKSRSVSFSNPFSAVKWMQLINGPHDLILKTPDSLMFKGDVTQIGYTSLGSNEYSTEAEIIVNDLRDSFVVGLPVQGKQYVETDKESFYSGDNIATVISPESEISMYISDSCSKQMFSFDRHAVEKELSCILGRKTFDPLIFKAEMPLVEDAKKWWDLSMEMRKMLESFGPFMQEKGIWEDMEKSFIRSLILSHGSNYKDEINYSLEQKPDFLLVIDNYIKEKYAYPISIEDLENISGVSKYKIYDAFKQFFGLTPMNYVKNVRLDEARKRLEKIKPGESIALIAFDCGITQLGRFSKEYKERFGELPSYTIKNN